MSLLDSQHWRFCSYTAWLTQHLVLFLHISTSVSLVLAPLGAAALGSWLLALFSTEAFASLLLTLPRNTAFGPLLLVLLSALQHGAFCFLHCLVLQLT